MDAGNSRGTGGFAMFSAKIDIMKMVHSAERAFARSMQGKLSVRLAQVKIDQMFFGIVGRYHRVHQTWSSSLLPMYRYSQIYSPRLFSIMECYIAAGDAEARLEVLRSLAAACFESIEPVVNGQL